MKTKPNFKLIVISLLIISCSNCRTKTLDLAKSSTKKQLFENRKGKSTTSEIYQGGHSVWISDSSLHQYTIKIVPRDSFSFSLNDGFRGRASSIEFTGMLQQRKIITDTSNVEIQKKSELTYDEQLKQKDITNDKIKAVKKKNRTWLMVFSVLGIVGILAWMSGKLSEKR